MFREMRRKKQLLSKEETVEILKSCTAGVLGLYGDDGYPYTVPMSYTYSDDKLYFHCAKEGHKIDGIKANDKVSFSVISRDEVIQETFTTHFTSVIVFGKARIVENYIEKKKAMEVLVEKYSPDYIKEAEKSIEKELGNISIIEIQIEHMTGKSAIEIINGEA